MAAKDRQSKFYRHIPLIVPFLLVFNGVCLAGDIDPSRYSPFTGDKFYILSETTFASDEEAKVRVEIPGPTGSLDAYSGIDIRVYRIPNPLEFLKKQRNLHRPVIQGNYAGEGISNALNYLWDSWYKKSRLAWQRIFSASIRRGTVEHVPGLKQTPPHAYQTQFHNNPQFELIDGLEVTDEFRYPLWNAKPISPPADVKLSGSSSEFLNIRQGNVYVPLGKRKPGLYVVEAILGTFRASAFVFVSNTVAVTKLSARQELVWTVDKRTGLPVLGSKLLFTDGVGVLGDGMTGKDGVFSLEGKALERSYVLCSDKDGGVSISENFYYDSEIYGAKIYVFTDRPLYRPGDMVYFKLLGREFKSSSQSIPLASSTALVSAIDPDGIPIISKKFDIVSGTDGGNAGFKLPEDASAGGYSLKINYKQSNYVSAFRVANYVKPHFDVDINFNKRDYKISEQIKGKIKLTYPNGKAVKDANIELEVRKQKLTIVEGELQYLDRFPVQVSKNKLSANKSGVSEFDVPAASEPTRYILTVRAVDNSSYRVKTTKEILVQAPAYPLLLSGKKNFSAPSEETFFKIGSNESGIKEHRVIALWEATRLEDQTKISGGLKSDLDEFSIRFEKPGSYTIAIKDSSGTVLASTNHWVQGPELASTPGTISILTDKDEYEAGETGKVHITFSEKVKEALVTFERDKVESYSLLSGSGGWIKLKRISDVEFSGEIPISKEFSPNIILSIAYVANGRYFFENKGIKVSMPKIRISFKPAREEYMPGETADVSVETTFLGKPIEASLAISVVDEMVYVMQPEIAPNISDFFYHLRRNQVRTSSSLSFYSFDAGVSATGASPSTANQYSDRSLKLRERPRREEKDTAFWTPLLRTDSTGRAKFSFVMPDSISRWRITGRAVSANGMVGQNAAYVQSQKDFYIKWTGPSLFRKGDAPDISTAIFNLTDNDKKAVFEAKGLGASIKNEVILHPGANYLTFPTKAENDDYVLSTLTVDGKVVDRLEKPIAVMPAAWKETKSVSVEKDKISEPISLPAGSYNVRLSITSEIGDSFIRAVDYLADYPYGCVEQTSSRLLPLALAYSTIQDAGYSATVKQKIQDRLTYERLRLVKMAGPEASFSWWGDQTATSAFMTAYAYYADWVASNSLNIQLPSNHWDYVLEAYKKGADNESALRKTLILWMAGEMGLPVKTLAEGVIDSVRKTDFSASDKSRETDSSVFAEQGNSRTDPVTIVLLNVVAKKANLRLPENISSKIEKAKKTLLESGAPFQLSVYLLDKENLSQADKKLAEKSLDSLMVEMPTIDRALSLAFIHKALGHDLISTSFKDAQELGKNWIMTESRLGRPIWRFLGKSSLVKLPDSLISAQAGASYHILVDTYTKEAHSLPVAIERKLYRLVQKDGPLEFNAVPITGDWQLSPAEIYLDEITLSPSKENIRYGLVEAALPPGAEVEQTSWGMNVKTENGSKIQIGNSSFQPGNMAYSVAIENLDKPVSFYHLIRFPQSGSFEIPPARFFRMYYPYQKGFEGGNDSKARKVVIR